MRKNPRLKGCPTAVVVYMSRRLFRYRFNGLIMMAIGAYALGGVVISPRKGQSRPAEKFVIENLDQLGAIFARKAGVDLVALRFQIVRK
jgi:hypothetical protein